LADNNKNSLDRSISKIIVRKGTLMKDNKVLFNDLKIYDEVDDKEFN